MTFLKKHNHILFFLNYMLYNNCLSYSGMEVNYENLFDKIGIELAKKIFAICICDNGTEFASFFKLEIYN